MFNDIVVQFSGLLIAFHMKEQKLCKNDEDKWSVARKRGGIEVIDELCDCIKWLHVAHAINCSWHRTQTFGIYWQLVEATEGWQR